MIGKAPSTYNFQPGDKLLKFLDTEAADDILSNIHGEYHYWDVIKHLKYPAGITAHDIWGIVKLKRRAAPAQIKFGDYHFHWNINNQLQEYLHFLDMNVGGSLESSNRIPSEDKGRYLVSSIMEEAIASSQIEGAATTRKKAKEMLRQKKKPSNRSEQMIVNNYVTIQRILEIKSEPLNRQNLLQIHRLITNDTLSNPAEEGALRLDDDIDVIDMSTGVVVHHPPDKKDLDTLLDGLCRFFNDEDNKVFIHPLIKACIIHFMVGFIHPFADGNGRTARALFYWYLLKKGYWLTEYLSISRLILKAKGQYARAFQYTEVDEHDLTYFLLFNLRVTKLAFDELKLYIQRKNEEKRKLSDFMDIDGINYRQAIILEWFYKDPALLLTVKETQIRLDVSNGSARNDLNTLAEKGYLRTRGMNKLTHAYIKGDRYDELIRSARDRGREE